MYNVEKENQKEQQRKIEANRIKELRIKLGYSQNEFADITDVSLDIIKNIENERQNITLDTARKIADSLNLTIDYLVGRSDYSSQEEILIEQIYKNITNFTLLDKEFIDMEGHVYTDIILSLNVNQYVTKFLFDCKKYKEKVINNEITEDAYKYKIKELKEDCLKALKNNIKIPEKYYLIPEIFGDKLFGYDIKQIK